MIEDILLEKSITKYRLSKLTGIPYTTISDICSGKTDIRRCSADTVYRIAEALGMTVEEILAPYYEERPDFELFKSNVCHMLKKLGDIDFMIEVLERKVILEYYHRKWYPEALYLLAMLDYVSRENEVPLCEDYNELRNCRLSRPVYPASVIARSAASKDDKAKKEAMDSAIPEFLHYNIIESEVRNVI